MNKLNKKENSNQSENQVGCGSSLGSVDYWTD